MKVSVSTPTMVEYFVKYIKRIVNKLTLNKFFKSDCEVKEIEELKRKIVVVVNDNGKKRILNIPKEIVGTPRDEDIFVSNLIKSEE